MSRNGSDRSFLLLHVKFYSTLPQSFQLLYLTELFLKCAAFLLGIRKALCRLRLIWLFRLLDVATPFEFQRLTISNDDHLRQPSGCSLFSGDQYGLPYQIGSSR